MNQPTTRRVYPNDPESIVYDMTFTEFHSNDLGYHRWLDAHPDGFVLTQWSQNPLGGMVHEAGCPYITRFRSTRTPKVCTTTLSDAIRYTWASKFQDRVRWFECVVCLVNGKAEQ
jgi:hypothetical protein